MTSRCCICVVYSPRPVIVENSKISLEIHSHDIKNVRSIGHDIITIVIIIIVIIFVHKSTVTYLWPCVENENGNDKETVQYDMCVT